MFAEAASRVTVVALPLGKVVLADVEAGAPAVVVVIPPGLGVSGSSLGFTTGAEVSMLPIATAPLMSANCNK